MAIPRAVRQARRRRGKEEVKLNITSMMDMFTIILVFLLKTFSPDKNEKVQMVFVFLLTVFMMLTITGIWFRGSGMKLVWPWLL